MALINWNQQLVVGVYEIDSQHKKLVDLLNDVHDAMKSGNSDEMIETVLLELLKYTLYHFATEERYFNRYNYPKTKQHIQEHEILQAKVEELTQNYENNKLSISIETTLFLSDCITNHIIKNDIEFGEYLRNEGLIL